MKFSFRILYIIIFLISIILAGIYFVNQQKVEAAKVTVEITKDGPFNATRFNETERDELIGNISLDKVYIYKLAQPDSVDMYLPGISVGLFSNKIMISGWGSISLKNKGVHELTLGLNQPIEKGDKVRIAIYISDEEGKVIIGKRKDFIWN